MIAPDVTGKDANTLPPGVARALLSVPPRALRALVALAANAAENGLVRMSPRQLAETLSTEQDRVSDDTAARALHALDARYGGTGHIIHVGTRPTEHAYVLRPFDGGYPNLQVQEDRFRKIADIRTVADKRTGADNRTDAGASVRNSAKLRISAPSTPPHIGKTTNHQPGDESKPRGGGGGGGSESGIRDTANTPEAEPQDGAGPATPPAELGRTEAPAATPADMAARVDALARAGVNNRQRRAAAARQFTLPQIAAAVRLAKKYSGGGGAVLHELTSGNAAEEADKAPPRSPAPAPAPAPTPADKLATARAALAAHAEADFNAAAHAARVAGYPYDPLTDAIRAVLRRDTRAALAMIRRGLITAEAIAANEGAIGRGALDQLGTHPLIRAAVAAELDAIDQGTPRHVPDPASAGA